MDIKQELRALVDAFGGHNPVTVREVSHRAVEEIERLEGELAQCRVQCYLLDKEVSFQRSAKNQARADLVKFTDRMIAAGLMS
jgi:hypothetical protein